MFCIIYLLWNKERKFDGEKFRLLIFLEKHVTYLLAMSFVYLSCQIIISLLKPI